MVSDSVKTDPPPLSSSTPDNPITATITAPLPLSTTSDTPTVATQEAGNNSSATIGGAVGGAVGLILIVVVVVVWMGRNRGRPHHQAGGFAIGLGRHQRQRPNLQVTALPITTPGPEHVVEKTRECRQWDVDSPGPTVTDDSHRVGGPDSEVLAKLDMIMERVARSSPGPTVDHGHSGGTDPGVLAKLDMIMERVARLEEDRDREEEAPPDYVSNRS
ncbi:hypothetical protein PQX77_019442 [Marasmius sp. AFHP31]|nr:hypothetical protein PQX77_019442 [Marasmius sp. AFHP31]